MTALAPSTGDQASRLRALVESLGATGPAARRATGGQQPAPLRRSARIITIASGKGGVGKTNLAVNLAIALVQRRRRVALLDADLGVANADVLCGLSPARRLESVLDGGGRSLREIAVPAPGGFRLVPGTLGLARTADLSVAQREHLIAVLASLEQDTDEIIIDASPGIGPLVQRLVAAADVALVVTTPEPTAVTDAYALIKSACRHGAPDAPGPPLALVINNAADRHQVQAARERLAAACTRFLGVSVPVLGWIAHDEHVPSAVFARHPVLLRSPRAPASRAIGRLAGAVLRRLDGGSGPDEPGMTVVERPWWRRLWRRLPES